MKPLFKPRQAKLFAGGHGANLRLPGRYAVHKPVFTDRVFWFAFPVVNSTAFFCLVSLFVRRIALDDGSILALAPLATSLTGLRGGLPEQNVFMRRTLIIAISFGIARVAEKTGRSLLVRAFIRIARSEILGVPWPFHCFVWLVVIAKRPWAWRGLIP